MPANSVPRPPWALRLISDVRSGEARSTLFLAAQGFLLAVAYLILSRAVAHPQSVPLPLMVGGALFYVVFWIIYALVVGRLRGRALITGVLTVATAASVAVSAIGASVLVLNVLLFASLHIGLMNLKTHFLWLALDAWDARTGLRLLPVVYVGIYAGALCGRPLGIFVYDHLGVQTAILLGAGLILLSLVPFILHERSPQSGAPATVEPARASSASTRYLALVCLVALVGNLVVELGTALYEIDMRAHGGRAEVWAHADQVRLFGGALGLIVAVFVVSRAIRYLGLAPTIVLVPLIATGAAIVMALNLLTGSTLSWLFVVLHGLWPTLWVSMAMLLLPLERRVRVVMVVLVYALWVPLGSAVGSLISALDLSASTLAAGDAALGVLWLPTTVVAAIGFHQRMRRIRATP